MNYSLQSPPQGAPRCWGRQHSPADRECQNCSYQYSCKQTFDSINSMPLPQTQQGFVQIQPQPPNRPAYPFPSYSPPPPPTMQQMPQWRPASVPYQAQQMAYPQTSLAHNPMDYMSVFGQQPYETTGERLGKNIMLRAMEAIFNELTRFFHYWTWI